MKTAYELMKDVHAKESWKALKLWSWAHDYEAKMTEWNNIMPPVSDDRRLFINTYQQVYEAVDSLPDDPCSWVCCAVAHEMAKDRDLMDGILTRFN